MFYDKEIKIINEVNGYVDDHGVYHEGDESIVKTIFCDIQPYSKERFYRDYGFNENVTWRVFCDSEPMIKTGITVNYGEVRYRVVRIIDWSSYMEVMIDNE